MRVARENIGKRLFSFSGVIPLGFFLLAHTWANASALRGQEAYVHTVDALTHLPLLVVLEILLVWIPLAYHAIYGLWLLRTALPAQAPYSRRLAVTNRVSAIVALAFIVWHVWAYRVAAARGLDPHAFYATLAWHLSSTWHAFPVRAVLYLVGLAATIFHFALGAWGYGVTSGFLATKREKRRAAFGALALGTLLFVVSSATVVSLATGLELSSAPESSTPCTPQK
ncbi:MAG TPA: succinate dehydrogenase [Polyangiaceae bacterium]|jgi:succinate dehydrogenase/fumarate reductase cytochrome b subunit (b558 family)